MTCPKPEVLSQWADGSLNPRESLVVSRHAEACSDCRRKAEELRAVGAWVATASAPGRSCLSAEDMAAVLEGGRVPAHVRTCPRCASEFRALRSTERKATRRRRKNPEQSPVMAWAAAAAIFIAIGILIAVANQQTAPQPGPVVQVPARPNPIDPVRPESQTPPAPPVKPPVRDNTDTAKNEPLRANPLEPTKRPDENPAEPVVKDQKPTTPSTPLKPTTTEAPAPPVKTPEAPRPVAALNVRSGALTAFADGKWVKPAKFEEGMALRAEGRTQLDFAQARVTLEPSSKFTVAKDEFSLNEGGASADLAMNSKFTLVLDEQKIVPQTLNGRVMMTFKPDRIVVEEGSAKIKDTLLAEGVEHLVKKGKIEAQKQRRLPVAARSAEKRLWDMKLGNENLIRLNIAGHIERDNQGARFLVSDTAKNPAIFYGQASYFSTGDEPPLFVVKPNTAIRFRYYMTQPGPLEFVMKNITKDENFNLPLDPVIRQWTTVTVYANDVPVNQGGKKVTCDLGDKYLGVTWFVGKPGSSSVVYIDRFEILEIDR